MQISTTSRQKLRLDLICTTVPTSMSVDNLHCGSRCSTFQAAYLSICRIQVVFDCGNFMSITSWRQDKECPVKKTMMHKGARTFVSNPFSFMLLFFKSPVTLSIWDPQANHYVRQPSLNSATLLTNFATQRITSILLMGHTDVIPCLSLLLARCANSQQAYSAHIC